MTGARAIAWQAAACAPTASAPSPASACRSGRAARCAPTSVMPQTADAQFYQLYFQQPGAGRGRVGARSACHRAAACSTARRARRRGVPRGRSPRRGNTRRPAWCRRGGGWLRERASPAALPAWLTRRGYRLLCRRIQAQRLPRSAQLLSQHRPQLGTDGAFAGVTVRVPALFIAGDHDIGDGCSPGMDQQLRQPQAVRHDAA